MACSLNSITNSTRIDIFCRDSFTCQYCGRKVPEVKLEVDHIIPKSKGGTNNPNNLITACFECNRGKKAKNIKPAIETHTHKEKSLSIYISKDVWEKAKNTPLPDKNNLHKLFNDYYDGVRELRAQIEEIDNIIANSSKKTSIKKEQIAELEREIQTN